MILKDKILVVDDDSTNLKIIEEILQDQYILRLATSGEQAIEELPKFKPDLILLDIMMPGMDGYETCHKIKNHPDFKYTKILILSAKALAQERLAGYEFGADDYITKPFNDEELLAKVKVYLKLKFLEELDCLRRNTLKSISQNINKPLLSMFGTDSLFANKTGKVMVTQELRTQLQELHDNGRKLMEFCNKTMLLCELKDGKDLVLENIAIEEFMEDIIKSINPLAKEKKIDVFYKNEINDSVRLDHQLIEKAILFLLQNSIKYSPSNSKIFISSVEHDEQCVIVIEDQGSGFMQRLFNEVSAINIDKDMNKTGEGVSMPIVEIIAKLHGGRFSQDRNDQGGVSFYFSIPITHN